MAHGDKYANEELKSKHFYENRPKRNYLRKTFVKTTPVPTIGLTALASFPVS